jgi:hypothetical protein
MRVATELLMDTGRRPQGNLRAPAGLPGPRQRRIPGPGLRELQTEPPGAAAAGRRGHRPGHHRPAAAGPRPLPRPAR